jgi:hypothetical protein
MWYLYCGLLTTFCTFLFDVALRERTICFLTSKHDTKGKYIFKYVFFSIVLIIPITLWPITAIKWCFDC